MKPPEWSTACEGHPGQRASFRGQDLLTVVVLAVEVAVAEDKTRP